MRQAAAWWRRLGTVEQLRVVFGVLAVSAVLSQVPLAVAGPSPLIGSVPALASIFALCALWLMGLRNHRFPAGAIVIEALAIGVLAVGLNEPHRALGPAYTMLFLRCLYGTHRAAIVRALVYAAVLKVAFMVTPKPADFVTFIPVSILYMTATMRALAVCLERVSQASELSVALAQTAGELLTAKSKETVRERCLACAKHIAPEAQVDVILRNDQSTDEPTAEFTDGLAFDLGKASSAFGVLLVSPPRPLSKQRCEALQTLAALTSAALESLGLHALLSYRASHDNLTDLPNRVAYTETLTSVVSAGTPCAALFIDLDDFKTVNDTLGHAAGDALLRQVAQRIKGCIRESDVAARLGGDEFAVLVHGDRDVLAIATDVAARLLDAFEDPLDLFGTMYYVRCSIGIALDGAVVAVGGSGSGADGAFLADDEAKSATAALLRNADIAMYVAKAGGKNRFEIFAPEMAHSVSLDLDVRQELESALTRRGSVA
jgi:diguanylate cyclase (GGDEF)-like protein